LPSGSLHGFSFEGQVVESAQPINLHGLGIILVMWLGFCVATEKAWLGNEFSSAYHHSGVGSAVAFETLFFGWRMSLAPCPHVFSVTIPAITLVWSG
jgi:hypothetical protein